MYYLAPACFLFLSMPCAFLEVPRLAHDTEAVMSVTVLGGSAVAAFALNLSIYTLIGEVRVAALAHFLLAVGLSFRRVSLRLLCGDGVWPLSRDFRWCIALKIIPRAAFAPLRAPSFPCAPDVCAYDERGGRDQGLGTHLPLRVLLRKVVSSPRQLHPTSFHSIP